jgi:hypothetical protein
MLHLTEARPDEFLEGAPRMAVASRIFAHNPVEIRQRATYHEKAPCFQYSPEVINHVNILRAQGGDAAVREYLNRVKEKTSMSFHTEQMEAGLRRNEAPAVSEVVTGTMEAALTDAETKVRFYDAEQKRCAAEAARWREVATSLKSVISLTTQPLAMVRSANGNGNGNGNGSAKWPGLVSQVLTKPMTGKELTDALQAASGRDRTVISVAVSSRKRAGQIVEIDGKLCLSDWTDPAKAS